MPRQSEAIKTALRYAMNGFPVFPLAPRSKMPLIAARDGGRGLHDAITHVSNGLEDHATAGGPQADHRVRSKRLSDVILLKEDGSGDPFERPLNGPEDWWLQLPHAYWLEGHYKTLRLPAKVMLLIALSRPDGFPLPYDRAANWYEVSSDSAEEGLRELRDTGLLAVERNWVKAPRSEQAGPSS